MSEVPLYTQHFATICLQDFAAFLNLVQVGESMGIWALRAHKGLK